MVPKAEAEASTHLKSEAKSKGLKAKKSEPKYRHIKKLHTSPTSQEPKTLLLWRQPKYPQKSASRGNKLDHHAIIRFPLTNESAMKKTRQQHTVFTVTVKANKVQLKQAVKKLSDLEVAKVDALIRPDGQKKAQVCPDDDALDVANKTGIL
ncbi:large ribosomal subunit protein uL23-like [Lepus europaeus]|uniref:large ribosomal subunit protein uL23-like n=1 Tax=Lepus europaeus TaxID=9983 RepID=UPI002B46FEC8|nr:large ribosomal subunit protein uL23-like [Lepus europaeus]